MLVLLIVTTIVHAQDAATTKSANHNRAYFNTTLSSQLTLPSTVLNLRQLIAFSFRTCAPGSLVRQSGANSNLEFSLTPGGSLQLSWQQADTSDSVTIGDDSLLSNEWFTVETQFLHGQIHLSIEKGASLLYRQLVSNSTLRKYLWDLDLSGGPGVEVGVGYSGCIQEGPSIKLSLEDAIAKDVRWGECPLEDAVYPACGKNVFYINTSIIKVEDRKSRITPQSRSLYGNFFHFMKIEKYAL